MTQIVRQSTAVDVLIGPFVDSTNGYDAETGLSPSVKLSKNGQALAAKNDVTTPVHDADGYYNCELDATDTNTVGTLILTVAGSATALAVRHEFQVVEEAVYDALFASSAAGPLQSTVAGRTLDVTVGGAAGIDWANVENPTTAVDLSATDIQLCDTVTTLTGHTAQTGDSYARLGAPAGASVSADIAAVKTDTAAILVDTGTTLPAVLGTPTDFGSGTSTLAANLQDLADDGTAVYDRSTDSLQAIRDRGDAAWTTGGGGSITDILNVQPLIPNAIDLADTATWRLGFMLTNALDDLPSTAEITPGTISIDRKAIGGTSWSAVVTDAACSEANGLVYYDEVFDSGTGYAEGDSIRLTFKSQKITVSANDYEVSDATGRIWYTSIRDTMRGTDSAYTGTPPTAAAIADAVLDEALSGHVAAGSLGKAVADIETDATAILADTGTDGVVVAAASKTGYRLSSTGVDDILDEAITEPSGVWAWSGGSLRSIIGWLGALSRNKLTQTATTQTLRNDADSADIATSTVSDDGTTATRGEFS